MHGPERRLDLAAKYDTLAGKVGWITVNGAKLDFTRQYGPQKSAVAFAVAVLRAKKPTPVLLDFTVPGHNILGPLLNGQPWRVPNHYGRQFSRTLKAGRQRADGETGKHREDMDLGGPAADVDAAAPGDVEIVPIEKLDTVAVLHPSPGR